jgi:MFS family permease
VTRRDIELFTEISGTATAVVSGHAAAIVARPLGALVFGRIGDRVGRRLALVGSLTLMGAATVGVGLLPTRAAIGSTAAVLLVLLRLLRGLAIGGEYPRAVVVAVEHAEPRRRKFFARSPRSGPSWG